MKNFEDEGNVVFIDIYFKRNISNIVISLYTIIINQCSINFKKLIFITEF